MQYLCDNRQRDITVIGVQADVHNLKNVKRIPVVPLADMPALYSTHAYIFHKPDKPGGGERVVFEGVLCGCKPLVDENASHESWKSEWDWTDPAILREKLDQAPYEFWKIVSKAARND
jgi:hypothetical protein